MSYQGFQTPYAFAVLANIKGFLVGKVEDRSHHHGSTVDFVRKSLITELREDR